MALTAGIVLACLLLFFLPATVLAFVSSWAISIHEVCHGMAALLTGGSIASLDVQWEHGLAMTNGGWYPIVSMAGYVGTAMFGALLLMASIRPVARWAALIFLVVATLLLVGHASFSGAFFFALVMNFFVGTCLFMDKKGVTSSFFAAMLVYPQWLDVQQLLWYQPTRTDAGLLAQYFGWSGLAWPIALIYTLGTVAVWLLALRYVVNYRGKSEPVLQPPPLTRAP